MKTLHEFHDIPTNGVALVTINDQKDVNVFHTRQFQDVSKELVNLGVVSARKHCGVTQPASKGKPA